MIRPKKIIKIIVPKKVWFFVIPYYHLALAYLSAFLYGFPSKKLFVIGITGTKGKTTTAEAINSILETAGYKTALAGTMRFKIGKQSEPNRRRMTMPGRFFLQHFLWRAKRSGCSHVVVEMTSEGASQFRHRGVYLDALIVTNLAPEHIEAHGSYENYVKAKISLAKNLEGSPKRPRYLVVNQAIHEADQFLNVLVEEKVSFSVRDTYPFAKEKDGTTSFSFFGDRFTTKLLGDFNIENLQAAASLAKVLGIEKEVIQKGIYDLDFIRGRMEKIEVKEPLNSLQQFDVFVDYAHTVDSLTKTYETFSGKGLVSVFGGMGAGRDHWKRPEMGKVAAKHCREIFITTGDPYDEDPIQIAREIEKGAKEVGGSPQIIIDRRQAIRQALKVAQPGDVVIITGKGSDPFIMGPDGKKTPWDDATVAKECLIEYLESKSVIKK